MKQLFVITALVVSSLSIHAQIKKSTCQITKEISKGIPQHDNLTIKFVGPTKQPVKRGVTMVANNDTIFPEINELGIYKDHLEPGTYKFNFAFPYWYDAKIEKLKCNKNETINIIVYFNPKDI
jgi:hypothetical protein